MDANAADGQRPVRLLLIEDNPADAELIVEKLKQHGLKVTYDLVSTPQEFQGQLGKEYDAILCNHDLRTWLGLEALAMFRRTGKNTPFSP